ncbi:MAG TPA: sulfatase [Thermoanaerobaculia bacterium]|nr:sulfatase [Thermoanaerobaculia bacterium]
MRLAPLLPRLASGVLLLSLLATGSCRPGPDPEPPSRPWERIDLWSLRPEVEAAPVDDKWLRVSPRRITFLGTEEVRNMSRVPEKQRAAFPKRPAGQIRALEQVAASRLRWRIQLGQEPYLSFIPLGTERTCPCAYQIAVRDAGGTEKEIFRLDVVPVALTAPAAVELDLSAYAGQEIDLLLTLDGPAGPPPKGQPFPSALWGSPGLYSRKQAALEEGAKTEREEKRPSILLVGFDTLRADALGAWGRQPSLTPTLDRLATESDVWLNAFSAFNVTNPSFTSILTGLYGKNHGIYDLKTPLPQSFQTLPELLSGAGYDTLAVIAAHHLGDHNSGLGQGFSEVTLAEEHFAAELAVDMTMDWLAERKGSAKPFFAWVHLFDPHTPHTPPRPYALGYRGSGPTGLSPVRDWVPFREPGPLTFTEPVLGGEKSLYDGEVAYLDRQFGRLLDWLESRGLLEDTIVAVVADHGESLGEHGIRFRHVGLHDTTTHVPLMIRWPGRQAAGRRIEGLVQTIDLFPTLLGAAGIEPPQSDGQDLRELTGEGRRGRRAVFAEHSGKLGLMVRTPEHKYILSQGNTFLPDGPSLFDLRKDPGETQNLAGQGLPAEKEMADLLTRWLADRRSVPKSTPRNLSPEEEARMRALGYL